VKKDMDSVNEDKEVEERLPTRRKIQADTTKKKIYEIAISLMEKKGFANTTINEISKKAGVSVGTFYNYFSSKEEIFHNIFKKADEYFERVVNRNIKKSVGSSQARIALYFRHYARYVLKQGFHNISQLYGTKTKLFAEKGRYMQELLKQVIDAGQQAGDIMDEMTPDQITEYLVVASRGVVYDWCIHEGSYNLESKMVEYMNRLATVFLIRKA
jgi:TetR/AcrR family transcriptional regulator, fatty acid metabolism regulator protein